MWWELSNALEGSRCPAEVVMHVRGLWWDKLTSGADSSPGCVVIKAPPVWLCWWVWKSCWHSLQPATGAVDAVGMGARSDSVTSSDRVFGPVGVRWPGHDWASCSCGLRRHQTSHIHVSWEAKYISESQPWNYSSNNSYHFWCLSAKCKGFEFFLLHFQSSLFGCFFPICALSMTEQLLEMWWGYRMQKVIPLSLFPMTPRRVWAAVISAADQWNWS